MKISEKQIALNQSGSVKILPQEPDDLWAIYNLLSVGDSITAVSTRKIHTCTLDGGDIHSSTSDDVKNTVSRVSRIRVTVQISVASVDYDMASSTLRVRGRSLENSEFVAGGTFHSLHLDINKVFGLEKKMWNAQAIGTLMDTCDRSSAADLAVVLVHQSFAEIHLIGRDTTTRTIEKSTNRKAGADKFYESVLAAFTKHVDFSTVRCVVIASPSSMNLELRNYLFSEARRRRLNSILDNRERIVLVKAKDLEEVFANAMSTIKDTKIAVEIRAMKELNEKMTNDCDRTCYGPKSVEAAHRMLAIETLLISDDLFRSAEIETRKKYLNFVTSVKNAGGKAVVISPSHVAGEQLRMLTGIAAILRFPLPYIDEMEL